MCCSEQEYWLRLLLEGMPVPRIGSLQNLKSKVARWKDRAELDDWKKRALAAEDDLARSSSLQAHHLQSDGDAPVSTSEARQVRTYGKSSAPAEKTTSPALPSQGKPSAGRPSSTRPETSSRPQPTRRSGKRKAAVSSSPGAQKRAKETVYPPKPIEVNQLVAAAYNKKYYVVKVESVQEQTTFLTWIDYHGDGLYVATKKKTAEEEEQKYIFASNMALIEVEGTVTVKVSSFKKLADIRTEPERKGLSTDGTMKQHRARLQNHLNVVAMTYGPNKPNQLAKLIIAEGPIICPGAIWAKTNGDLVIGDNASKTVVTVQVSRDGIGLIGTMAKCADYSMDCGCGYWIHPADAAAMFLEKTAATLLVVEAGAVRRAQQDDTYVCGGHIFDEGGSAARRLPPPVARPARANYPCKLPAVPSERPELSPKCYPSVQS
ncbi:Hypp6815 [Branchiostoma lanceolatum]|uniref:Hypp6815 protein n=1 Tax=Branchiostoma lanceolatum TaxID=7740 RepID=A0A8J9YVQ0_BRALA|nr:Hypp6815 [Branchiostoma lanceolatum]